MRDAEKTLPAFIQSVERQTLGLDRVRVVLVDNESTDGSAEVLRQWHERAPEVVSVVQCAGGRAEALNAGLAQARGHEWVSFPDPCDTLDRAYLERIDEFVAEHPSASLVAGRVVQWNHHTGQRVAKHPLDARFVGSPTLIDLDQQGEYFANCLATAFVRADRLLEHSLAFDPRITGDFQDGHLLARYLLAQPERLAGFVTAARYYFRRREDVKAGGRSAFVTPAKFTDTLRYGYLELCERALTLVGFVPEWLQHALAYELSWYMRGDEVLAGQMNADMHGVGAEYHELVTDVARHLEPAVLAGVDPSVLPLDRLTSLAHGYRGETWHESLVILDRRDTRQGLVRLSYRYAGTPPQEELRVGGVVVAPRHGKRRALVYAGRPLAYERVMWVSSLATIRIKLDGVDVPISRPRPPRARTWWRASDIRSAFGASPAPRRPRARVVARKLTSPRWWLNKLVRVVATRSPLRSRFANSWVLIDRVHSAHDNAEHLFTYLRENEPTVNAWFAVERGTADWHRLRKEHPDRVLAYGSMKWALVCLNATHVLSSQAGPYVYAPEALNRYGRARWRFIFLQHGVIGTDLSRWLNRRNFDLFVTTTPDEYAAIAGDDSPYKFTTKEVVMTGLPRHDRLVRLDRALSPQQRQRILVAPTWREYLLGPKIAATGERALLENFEESQYARAWAGLLSSERLHALARERGATISFMPHPNIQPYLDRLHLPADVEVLTYEGNDVQAVLASAKLVVTDFSSIVFDTALIARPMVYFQFDQDQAFGGTHTVRQGYFSYVENGFGPVVATEELALDAIETIARNGFTNDPIYQARMDATFGSHDAGSCARVVEAVRGLDVRLTVAQSYLAVPTPAAPATAEPMATHEPGAERAAAPEVAAMSALGLAESEADAEAQADAVGPAFSAPAADPQAEREPATESAAS